MVIPFIPLWSILGVLNGLAFLARGGRRADTFRPSARFSDNHLAAYSRRRSVASRYPSTSPHPSSRADVWNGAPLVLAVAPLDDRRDAYGGRRWPSRPQS